MRASRRSAREAAVRILYLREIGRAETTDAIESFFATHDPEASTEVRAFASELAEGTAKALVEVDALISRHATGWRLERLAVLDRLILRVAIWELQHQPATPTAVVINEAIELAKRYGTDDSPKFVNGVLDAVARALGPRDS